jgi:simple sugar transport system ATP-binding protein
VPEDRVGVGLCLELSLAENLVLETYGTPALRRGPFLRARAVAAFVDRLLADYRVRAPDRAVPAKTLSGGHLQRLLLARALAREPALLVVHQPTRGLDVAATEEVHARLLALRDRGVAVLMISEDLDELLTLADRIAVLYEGRVMGVVPAAEARREEIGLMMAGMAPSPQPAPPLPPAGGKGGMGGVAGGLN